MQVWVKVNRGVIKSRLSDEELGIECLDSCLLNYHECKEACTGSSSCKLDCGIDLTNCLNSCPCQGDCPTGCDQCESDFCQGVQCRDPEANEDYIACEERILKT